MQWITFTKYKGEESQNFKNSSALYQKVSRHTRAAPKDDKLRQGLLHLLIKYD